MLNFDDFFLDTKETLPALVIGAPIRGTHLAAELNNRSRYSKTIIAESAVNGTPLCPLNNCGLLYLTKAFGQPATYYLADWKSTASFCFTFFDMKSSAWALVTNDE